MLAAGTPMIDTGARGRGGSLSNAFANWINFFVSAILGLIVNPLLLQFLGVNAFGAWKGTQRVLDLAGVVDGRSAQALKWVVAHRHSSATTEEKRRDVGASLIFGLMMSPILLLACTIMVLSLPVLIQDVPSEYADAMYVAGALLGANVVLRGLLMVPDAVLVGTNQGYRSMNLTTVFLVLSNVAMVLAAFAGWGIASFGLIVLVSSLGNAAATWIVARRRVTWWGFARPTRDDVRRVGGFSAWSMGWRVVNQSLASVDGILIGALVGAAAITQFTFTSYVVTFSYALAQATTSALMPGLGRSIGSGADDEATARVRQVGYVNLWIVATAAGLVLALNGGFVTIWAGEDMFMGQLFNMLLVACFVQVSLTRNSSQIQDAALKIRRRVVVGLISTIVSIALAILGFTVAGEPYGILIGLLIGRLPMMIIYRLEVDRIVPGGRARNSSFLFAGALLAIAAMIGFWMPALPTIPWLAVATCFAASFAAATWFLILPKGLRQVLVKVAVNRLPKRFKRS